MEHNNNNETANAEWPLKQLKDLCLRVINPCMESYTGTVHYTLYSSYLRAVDLKIHLNKRRPLLD